MNDVEAAANSSSQAPVFLRQLSVCDSPPMAPITETRVGQHMIVEGAMEFNLHVSRQQDLLAFVA